MAGFNYRGYKWQEYMRRNLYGAIKKAFGNSSQSTGNSGNNSEKKQSSGY